MSGNQEQLADLLNQIGYRETTHPVTKQADHLTNLPSLLTYTLAELRELEEEYEKLMRLRENQRHLQEKQRPAEAEAKKARQQFLMEFADFMVMLKLVIEKLQAPFSLEERVLPVNGQFNGRFDSLYEQTVNLGEGRKIVADLDFIFCEALSLLKFLNIELQAEALCLSLNRKLWANREPRFFQIEPGMNEADLLQKANHAFRVLRLLRRQLLDDLGLEMHLQTWITDFFAPEILDWRHSEQVLGALPAQVAAFRQMIADQVSWTLTAQKPASTNNQLDPQLEAKLKIAGACSLSPAEAMVSVQADGAPAINNAFST